MNAPVAGAALQGAGKVVLPQDRRYPLLRSTYTSVSSPSCVVLATGVDDIRDALRAADDHGLALAVRSGGHSLSGSSSNDGGLVVDLSQMSAVRVVDRGRRLVRVQPGARWGAVAEALRPHRLAISSGNFGNVGVGGLATGGGIGWLVRSAGLTIDHIREVRLVLADGSPVTANATQHPDLFWAVRGAASQVGIVVDFLFEAVDLPGVGIARFEVGLAKSRRPLVQWDFLVRHAPRELTLELQMQGQTGAVTAVWAGTDLEAAAAALAPFTGIGPVRGSARFRTVPYAALVPRSHEHPNVGQQRAVTHNGMVDTVTNEVESTVLDAAAGGVFMQFRSLGGAISDIPADATSYANRHQSELIIGTVFHPGDEPHLDRVWNRLRPAFTGAYFNFETRPTATTSRLAFPPDTWRRLHQLRQRYDPQSVLSSMAPRL